jgi:hypothetical protein
VRDAATGETLWRKTLSARASTALVVVGKAWMEDDYLNWIAIESGDAEETGPA